jgi:hypothetical protein
MLTRRTLTRRSASIASRPHARPEEGASSPFRDPRGWPERAERVPQGLLAATAPSGGTDS